MNMSYGWDNIWPEAFNSIKEAHKEIEDFVTSTEEATLIGNMAEAYLREDFKIVEYNTSENVYEYIVGCKIC